MLSKLGTKLSPLAVALAVLVCAACQQSRQTGAGRAGQSPGAGSANASSASSETEKTNIMQQKAADIERRLAEIQEQRQAGMITDDEAMQAVVALDAERRAVMEMGEGGDQQAPPPPPQ